MFLPTEKLWNSSSIMKVTYLDAWLEGRDMKKYESV